MLDQLEIEISIRLYHLEEEFRQRAISNVPRVYITNMICEAENLHLPCYACMMPKDHEEFSFGWKCEFGDWKEKGGWRLCRSCVNRNRQVPSA